MLCYGVLETVNAIAVLRCHPEYSVEVITLQIYQFFIV